MPQSLPSPREAADQAAPPQIDSTADSSLVSDSTGIGQMTERVGEAGRFLAEGQVDVALSTLMEALGRFALDNLVPAVLVALAFWVIYRVVRGVLMGALGRSRRIDQGVRQLVLRTLRLVVGTFAVITVLGQLGINVAALVAGLGIAGIALGFAARDTLENFIAGVTILLDRPFRVGDNIELQDTFGTVEEITLRTTRLRTLSNEMAVLPNAKVITDKIINHTMLRALRVEVPFGIAYKESTAEARKRVLALLEGDDRLHPDFEPSVVVKELGDSAVNMEMRFHLKDPKVEVPVRFEYQEKIFTALKEAGIEIPFPHLQLFIDEAKAFAEAPFMQGDGIGYAPPPPTQHGASSGKPQGDEP